MIEIKSQASNYKIESTDAIINNDTIIPGISGNKINIKKSYNKMKRYGKYDESLLVYENYKPKISIENNIDKYIISGNDDKNMISLIFLVEKENSIDRVIDILEDKRVEASFLIDGNVVEKNKNLIKTVISYNHTVGNIGYNYSYNNDSYPWLSNYIKKYQENNYCYTNKKDKKVLNMCYKNNDYTILPSIIIDKSIDNKIKENIKSGSIIALKINETTINELPILINYIVSKGYTVSNLDNHLEE